MWRSFANSLCSNTYENYLRKHNKLENCTSSSNATKEPKKSEKLATMSLEAAQLIQNYEDLQKKVVQQRENIKKTDELQEKKKAIKFFRLNRQKDEEKLRKIIQNQTIRSFSSNKAKKKHSLDLNTKKTELEDSKGSLFLTNFKQTSPIPYPTRPSSQVPSRQKTMMSVRDYQEKVLKELKPKIPNYFKGLKEEFIKIRNKSEQTFEQYVDSKKLKWKNPFDINLKSKKRMSVDV